MVENIDTTASLLRCRAVEAIATRFRSAGKIRTQSLRREPALSAQAARWIKITKLGSNRRNRAKDSGVLSLHYSHIASRPLPPLSPRRPTARQGRVTFLNP